MTRYESDAEVRASDEPAGEGDYWWLLRVWAVVAVFGAITVVRSFQVGISIRDPHGSILVSRLGISLGLFLVMVLIDAVRRTGRRGWTLARTGRMLRERWTLRRTTLSLSGLLAYHLVYHLLPQPEELGCVQPAS